MAKKKTKKKRYEKAVCPFLNMKCREHKCRLFMIDVGDCAIIITAERIVEALR